MNEPIVQEPLAFIDLQKQRARLDGHIDRAIQRVLAHGQFIMGPEVGELEAALCEFCGASHTITCSNGTDALGLILMALSLAAGDAVLCPSCTFAATAEVVAWFGAMPRRASAHPTRAAMSARSEPQRPRVFTRQSLSAATAMAAP